MADTWVAGWLDVADMQGWQGYRGEVRKLQGEDYRLTGSMAELGRKGNRIHMSEKNNQPPYFHDHQISLNATNRVHAER